MEKWASISLCYNIFNPTWRGGLEEAVRSIDDKLRVPLPEIYMAYPPGSFELTIVLRCPSLVIREDDLFFQVWPKMEASIHFLL